jgi:phage-related protein
VKPLIWLGSSLEDIRRFSSKARQAVGYQLYKVQNGLEPSDWKPMTSIWMGVKEIRVHTEKEHRIIYITSFEEAVYVLHAFIKKTAQTPKGDLDLAARRFRELQKSRRGGR